MKSYHVSDLFFTNWEALTGKLHSIVYAQQQKISLMQPDTAEYGFALIEVLKSLRKIRSLVNKINVEQAVDIYNDLTFLKLPWYYFPHISYLPGKNKLYKFKAPEDYMARHTFDHFIYADNEFTTYIATQDVKYLHRLMATIYTLPGDLHFDKECVTERQAVIAAMIKDWQLTLVFFTYGQVREFVTKRCKTLLPTTPPNKTDDDHLMQPTSTGGMWLKLKHRLAETPAFQGYDNAGRANMYSALDYLEDLAQQKENGNGKS